MKSINITARIVLMVSFVLSTISAFAAEYDTKDVVAFNSLIRDLGLNAKPDAPETWVFKKPNANNYKTWGQDPRDYDGFVVWSNSTPKRIKEMWLYNKGINGTIDFSDFPALENICVNDQGVNGINVSKNNNLLELSVFCKKVTELNLSGNPNLRLLSCEGCSISELDFSANPNLMLLLCASNDLKEIRLLNNPRVSVLDCRNNRLSELDLSLCPDISNWKVDSGVNVKTGLTESQVRQAWNAVCKAAELNELPLKIEHSDAPNAWVDSRNNVTVTTGLMRILSREEEIAGVLLHEASHAKMVHSKDQAANALGTLLIFGAIGAGLDSTAGWITAASAARLAMAGYSRQQEVAADDLATDLAIKNGIDPTGIYTALERMAIVAGRNIPSGFNSHPPDYRRLGRIERRIHEANPSLVIEKLLGLPELPAGDDGTNSENIPVQEDQSVKERRERKGKIDEMMKELGM